MCCDCCVTVLLRTLSWRLISLLSSEASVIVCVFSSYWFYNVFVGIELSMPEQIEQYEKEVRARAESLSSQAEVSN